MKLSKYFWLLIFVSLLPLVAIFLTPDIPHTHDGAVHLPRLAAYYKALSDGQILPRWAGDLNFGYGLPLFNFIYHTPYLIAAPLIGMGVSLVLTFKLLLLISFLSAGIFMYAFTKKVFKNDRAALLVTLFYQFAPFRLVEMLVRGSLGELYTYAFLPLVLYGLASLFEKISLINISLTAIATLLLIISHNSISLVFFGVSLLYALFFARTSKNLFWALLALTLGLMASSFYWVPAVIEHKYTHGDLYMKDLFRLHFPPISQFFIPNLFNNKNLETQGIATQLGLFHALALAGAAFWLLAKAKISWLYRRTLIFSLVLAAVAFFFMSRTSEFIWERISFLRQFQFPWRFLSLTSFATALTSVSFLALAASKKNLLYWLLLTLLVASTVYYWYPPLGFDKATGEAAYWNYPLNTTFFGETDVIWSAGPAKEYPSEPVTVAEGKANVSNYLKRSTLHTFQVHAETNSLLVDKTQYFPGWRVYVDDVKAPVEFQNPAWRGLITFSVTPGEHMIKVIFEKSKIQFVSEIISWLTLFSLFFGLIIYRKKKFV